MNDEKMIVNIIQDRIKELEKENKQFERLEINDLHQDIMTKNWIRMEELKRILPPKNKSDKEKPKEIVEIGQAREILSMIRNNPDVKISDKLKEFICDFSDDALIKRTYKIDKGIEILNLQHVTEDLISKEAFKDEVKIYCNLCGKGNEKNEFEVFMIDGFPKNICTKCLVSIRWLKPINPERVYDLCGETSPKFQSL